MTRIFRAIAWTFLAATIAACGAPYIESDVLDPDLELREDPDTREIVELVERYERALRDLDLDTISALVSRDYFENAGTTDTEEDDFGYAGLMELFETLQEHVREVRAEITIRDMRIEGDRANVRYEYTFRMLYNIEGEASWQTKRDIDELDLQREQGNWRIVGGL